MLLQVHWLRVILDEGHMLGASLSITNKLQMAIALRAERRWVMTGGHLISPGVLNFSQPVLACGLPCLPWMASVAAMYDLENIIVQPRHQAGCSNAPAGIALLQVHAPSSFWSWRGR